MQHPRARRRSSVARSCSLAVRPAPPYSTFACQRSIGGPVSSSQDPAQDRRSTDATDACRAALESDALLDALVDQETVGITIVDRNLRIVRANRAFGVFGDRTPAQVVGRLIGDVLPRLASQI